jgi:hypothetical protein
MWQQALFWERAVIIKRRGLRKAASFGLSMRNSARRSTQAIIGLYIATHVLPDGLRLTPQNCSFLVPSSALTVREEGCEHMLLMLQYGRSQAEVDLFMQSLMGGFPLLVRSHTAYYANRERSHLYRLKQRLQGMPGATTWSLQEVLREFSSLRVCMAFLVAQVRLQHWIFFFWGCHAE